MCVMTVHKGQQTHTMIQACAHNVHTVLGDMDLLTELAKSRDVPEADQMSMGLTYAALQVAYESLLAIYGEAVARAVKSGEHQHDNAAPVGNERIKPADAEVIADAIAVLNANTDGADDTTEAEMRRDAHLAEQYETR